MIKYEIITCKNGMQQQHTYSDSGFMIKQIETDLLYSEAYDNIPVQYTYEETNEPIEVSDSE